MITKVTPRILKHLFSNGVKGIGVFVFTEDSFNLRYPKVSRAYAFGSSSKFFDGTKLGSSLFGSCLDGADNGVRLDLYMKDEAKPWKPSEEAYVVDTQEELAELRKQFENE